MTTIDLNCDLGEGAGFDEEIMPFITSANIACGGHAGDEATMRESVELSLRYGVAIGAHPGFPDREHFGRRELAASPAQIGQWVREQTYALINVAQAAGARVNHVKPHGALYNMAARDPATADVIAAAIKVCDARLILIGLSGSELVAAGRRAGLRVGHEVFADRAYHRDGTLVARTDARALIDDVEVAVERMIGVLHSCKFRSVEGEEIALRADTICVHGDGVHAVDLARALRSALVSKRISVEPLVV